MKSLNDKILAWSKMKSLAYDKLKVSETAQIVLDRVESFLRKGDILMILVSNIFSFFSKSVFNRLFFPS